MTKGIASVTDFRGSCTPGGYINASIATDIVNSIFLEFPNYKNETFAKATKQTIVGDFTLKFCSCIVGGNFDFLTTKSTCSLCQNSYSFSKNDDNLIISCKKCPSLAAKCFGENIILLPGTWRWGHFATTIFKCPLKSGCLGKLQ